jgi:hypothetical protein
MGFTFKVETKKLSATIQRLNKLDGMEIEVGFFEEDRYGPENENQPVAQIAAYNEFGTATNPTRPFMEETFLDKMLQRHMVLSLKRVFSSAILNGRSVERLLRDLGDDIATHMQTTILNYPGSNSPSTIERKGKNTPLRDTEKMLESVKFQIHKKGGKQNA